MPKRGGLLLVRPDLGVDVGIGHVMRCLALSQVWLDRGRPVAFVVSAAAPEVTGRLVREGIAVHDFAGRAGADEDATATAEIAARDGASWVLLDGYGFGSAYRRIVRGAGLRLACIEDRTELDSGPADLILNQNAYAQSSPPAAGSGPRALMGTRYALLRREFEGWRESSRPIAATARRILITMGGSDPANATLKAVGAVRSLDAPDLAVRIAAGPANPNRHALAEAADSSGGRVELCSPKTEMPELMAWADLAISAAGSTCWELAFMGVPTIAVTLAENQRPIAASLETAGTGIDAGWNRELTEAHLAETLARLLPDEPRRSEMSRRGRALVDGRGAERVADALEDAIPATGSN